MPDGNFRDCTFCSNDDFSGSDAEILRATSEVLPYAQEYTRITAIGFPFLIANTGMSKLILADGSPRYSMTSMLVGAIVNTILDPIFIFGLHMGMKGRSTCYDHRTDRFVLHQSAVYVPF